MKHALKILRNRFQSLYSRKSQRQKALEELKRREDIVIKNADKGGAVVILHVKDY